MSGKECLVKNFLATVHEQAGNGQKPLPSLPTEPKRSASSSDPFVAALKAAEECRAAKENDKAVLALERASQIRPSDPRPYFHMAMLRTASSDCEGACKAALRAIELSPGKHLGVLPSELKNGVAEVPKGIYPQIGLRAAVMAFDLLIRAPCDAVARPSWWNDAALLAMSARALQDTPSSPYAISVRTHVLIGIMGVGQEQTAGVVPARGWPLGGRSAAQLREAAGLLKVQAQLEAVGSPKAAQALQNAAAILEAAHRIEAEEVLKAKLTARGLPAAAASSSSNAPPSPVPPAPDRTAALLARKKELEEQVAALERQLAGASTGGSAFDKKATKSPKKQPAPTVELS